MFDYGLRKKIIFLYKKKLQRFLSSREYKSWASDIILFLEALEDFIDEEIDKYGVCPFDPHQELNEALNDWKKKAYKNRYWTYKKS